MHHHAVSPMQIQSTNFEKLNGWNIFKITNDVQSNRPIQTKPQSKMGWLELATSALLRLRAPLRNDLPWAWGDEPNSNLRSLALDTGFPTSGRRS
jgi:hypothetical protein